MLLETHGIKYDPLHHRLRCNGHIINLTAQAFLFSTDEDALDSTNNLNSFIPTEQEMESWRRKGPLGKLHNLVVYIQRSPQRSASFQLLSSGRKLVRDNKTRWNSWYAMIDCAIHKRMKPAIDVYCHQTPDLHKDSLSAEDWINLTHIHRFLKSFHEVTLATEGEHATIERVLPTMDFLLDQFELAKTEYPNNPFMGPMINSGWAKLDKYYGLTDRSPVYITSMVMITKPKVDLF